MPTPAAPAAPPARGLARTTGLPFRFGDTADAVRAALATSARLETPSATTARGNSVLRDRALGVAVYFGPDKLARSVRVEAPFGGTVAGVRIGDDLSRMRALLGTPQPAATLNLAGLSESARRAMAQAEARRHRYALDTGSSVVFEVDADGRIVGAVLAPRVVPAAARVAAAPAPAPAPAPSPPPGCDDPFIIEPARFQISDLEVADSKTGLVWFRCPALWVGPQGKCDPSMVLPSETWASAVEVPRNAPRRRTSWRLASVEELDTIASKGCDYVTNPKLIEINFETVWTRTEAGGGNVYRYGTDRQRIATPRTGGAPNTLFAQTIYVRDGP